MFKLISFNERNAKFLAKVCGLFIGVNVWGNCFAPAIVLDPYKLKGKQACKLTVRFNQQSTIFYWYGGISFRWNSEHLVRRFGKEFEAPHGICWQWDSRIFGHHCDV